MPRARNDETRRLELEYNRKYRAEHPEKIKEQRARGAIKQRIAAKKWQQNNPKKCQQYVNTWKIGKTSFDNAKIRAKKKEIPFTVSRAYVDSITPTHCPVLGIELIRGGSKGPKDNSFSIDRIIPSKGYEEGNIIIVSNRANRLRSDSNPTELRIIADFYENLLKLTT